MSIILIFMSVLISVLYCLDCYNFVADFENMKYELSNLALPFPDFFLASLDLLHFHMNFKISLSVSVNKIAVSLWGIALNL